jgi:hypothetical protein
VLAVGNVDIQVGVQCLVKMKMKVCHLMFNDGSRECGHSGRCAMSGENENESISFNVQ